MEQIDRNPDPIYINEKENSILVGIWNKNNQTENNYNDPSVYYFEASLYYQYAVNNSGKIEAVTEIQTHPCVPCTKELFYLEKYPDFVDDESLR